MRKFAITASLPVFLLAARFMPFDRLPPVCLFRRLTGYPCPTCGMIRSVMALVHLHLHESLRFNSLGPAVVGVFALWWVDAIYRSFSGRTTKLSAWADRNFIRLTAVALGVLLAFGAVRLCSLCLHFRVSAQS